MADPRVARLKAITRKLAAVDKLKAERDALLREMAAEDGYGKQARLAQTSGLSVSRIHQILSSVRSP